MNITIVGAGEVGRHLAELLSCEAHNVAVVESSEKQAAELNEQLDAQVVCGSGASVTTLAEANVAECDLFLALTSDSHTNLVAASVGKALGARKTIARIHSRVQRDEWLFDYKAHFGIDYLFSLERLAAVELAKYVRNPERLLVEELARGRIELQQIPVSADSRAAGRTILDLALPPRIRLASITRDGQQIIPTARDALQAGDLVTVIGEPNTLATVLPLLHPGAAPERDASVVIFGGTDYGYVLAQMLEGHKLRVRIIEKDPKVCRQLSTTLQSTVVINGNATSLQQLREEQVGDAEFFISASPDDEDNVMACLQARNLGTRYCLTLVHRADYANVIMQNSEQLGILAAVSPRLATARDLLRFVTSDRFHVMMKLKDGAEVLEINVTKASPVAGRKVAEVRWPEGSGLVALLQGQQALVPIGDDVIQPGDTLYAMVLPRAREALVSLLT